MDIGKLEEELKVSERRVVELERALIKERLRGELLRRNARTPDLIAEYLAEFVRYDDGDLVVLDEDGYPRVKILPDEEGRYHPIPVEIEDLVDEFLEANPHFLSEEEAEEEPEQVDRDLEERYREAMEEARRHGRPTGDFIKLMAKKYAK